MSNQCTSLVPFSINLLRAARALGIKGPETRLVLWTTSGATTSPKEGSKTAAAPEHVSLGQAGEGRTL